MNSGLSDFKAQITLLHSAAFSFIFVSVKPLWESRLPQLCLEQLPKRGWVHALASVRESTASLKGGGEQRVVERGSVDMVARLERELQGQGEPKREELGGPLTTPSPRRRGFFLMLNLEND